MIKALLYKDFNALKRYAKIMLVVAVVCSFLFKDEGSSLIVMIYAASLLLTTMAIDEREHFLRRAISDSGRNKAIVGEKYILLFLLVMAAVVISLILEVAMAIIYKRPIEWENLCILMLSGFALTSFSGGITIPLTLKFGSEKARIILLLCYMVPAVLLMWLLPNLDIILSTAMISILIIVSSLVMYLVSFFISIKILKKKDF